MKYCILCLLGLAVFTACNDALDRHYSEQPGVAPNITLWQLIEEEPNLSLFAEMLKKTGYDIHLSSSQAFTVWAPTNDALQGVDMRDDAKLKNIVSTHIARFKYTADSQINATVFTLNAKQIPFTGRNDSYYMDEAELATVNHLASNGILHTIKTQIPFVKNIWEYLTEPGMDSIRNYFNAFHTKIFIPGGSEIIDYENGMAVYDSIFLETNTLFYTILNGVGFLNDEDSIYTLILPNNTAWNKAYDVRKPFFETTAPNADSVQHWNTQYAIVQDLVFRGRIDNPGERDSLISTRGNVFYNPARLFPANKASKASNGLVYITDELKHEYGESWQHPLKIEAEETQISRSEGLGHTEAKVQRVYIPGKPDIPSNVCYLISSGNNSLENTFLLLNIPNTLKAEYNIYAVFAPIRYLYPNFTSERTKIMYDIQQLDRSTADKPVEEQVWNSLVGVTKGGNGKKPDDNETDSASVKKMFLTSFAFPEANYRDEATTIRVKLSSRVTASEARNGYNNRMLLDYILLEPVQ